LRTVIESGEADETICLNDLARAFANSSVSPDVGTFNPFDTRIDKVSELATTT
jgi:hypothetical protein